MGLCIGIPIDSELLAEYDGDEKKALDSVILAATNEMYMTTDDNKFIEVTYARGEREMLYFKDFVSGAMIRNIVDRAKKSAVKRLKKDFNSMIWFKQFGKNIRKMRTCQIPLILTIG